MVGRPAEVAQGPNGAVYISDDYAGVIYRVAYGESQRPQLAAPVSAFSAENTLAAMSEPELLSLSTQGEGLYNTYGCAGCHADDGSGLKTLEDLGGKYDLDTLSEYIRRPNSPMPTFPFSDEERRALSVYLIGRYPGM